MMTVLLDRGRLQIRGQHVGRLEIKENGSVMIRGQCRGSVPVSDRCRKRL